MELHSYMKEGMIENWDMFEKILDYSYDKVQKYSFTLLIFIYAFNFKYFADNSVRITVPPSSVLRISLEPKTKA